MSPEISPAEWVRCVASDYLDTFVRDGGSAVRFGVACDDGVRRAAVAALLGVAETRGYLVVSVDAALTKVHMMDQVFSAIAAQVPWPDLARRVCRTAVEGAGRRWPDSPGEYLLDSIAESNEIDRDIVAIEIERQLRSRVYDGEGMVGQFRSAMYWMCRELLERGPAGAAGIEALSDWLTRRSSKVATVKPFGIGGAIQRGTARHYLESLARWVRMAGLPGMVVLLDISRVSLVRNPVDGRIFYTQLATYDTFETLRKLIDGVERLEGTLVAVLPGLRFDHEDDRRGLFAYDALRFRIADDVHDARRANPTGMLVRLGG